MKVVPECDDCGEDLTTVIDDEIRTVLRLPWRLSLVREVTVKRLVCYHCTSQQRMIDRITEGSYRQGVEDGFEAASR